VLLCLQRIKKEINMQSDLEIYSPVTTDDNTTIITDGNTDLMLMAITNNDNIAVLVPVNEAKDPDGRAVKVLQLSVLQAIVAKPFVPSAEIVEPVNITPEPLTVTVSVNTDTKPNFWQQYQVQIVPNFKPETVKAYKEKTDPLVFNEGQAYESPDGGLYTVVYRLEDRLQIRDNFGNTLIRHINIDDGGEFIRPTLDERRLYAGDTPEWFYGSSNIEPDLELNRLKRLQDRDCDLASVGGRVL
jgi:hypothetical protein